MDGLTLELLMCEEAEVEDSGTGLSSISMAVHCKIGESVSWAERSLESRNRSQKYSDGRVT